MVRVLLIIVTSNPGSPFGHDVARMVFSSGFNPNSLGIEWGRDLGGGPSLLQFVPRGAKGVI